MATKFVFDNKLVKLPGAYATIKSGINNIPTSLSWGNILIIDTGSALTGFYGDGLGLDAIDDSNTSFVGGAGIAGELSSGQDAIYEFTSIAEFQNFARGGMWWTLKDPLFNPANGAQGVSKIYFVKAAATTAGEMTFTPAATGGTFVINTIDEGTVANGVEDTTVTTRLVKGYAYTVAAGTKDTAKVVFKFWRGQYKGLHTDGLPNDTDITQVQPEMLCQSPELSTLQGLFDWAATDTDFNTYFKVKTATGSAALSVSDIVATNVKATAGTETYNTTHLATALEAVRDLDYSFVLCDKYGNFAQGAENGLILAHLTNDAKFEKQMVVAGGSTSGFFAETVTYSSIDTAQYYNSDKVIVVHGGIKKNSNLVGSGFRLYDSIYKAAAVLGRICGLAPQIPITFKSINIDGEQHNLTVKLKETAIDNGVLATYYDDDFKRDTILQGVNSLQRNNYLVNNDGTTYSIQLRRITSQINKELQVNIKNDLLGNPAGANRNTISESFLKTYVGSYLKSKIATQQVDNLLIEYRNITITRNQDALFVTYEIVPNGEITKIFLTGFLVD